MEEQKSFSQRVKETVVQCADLYKKYYVPPSPGNFTSVTGRFLYAA